jgi:hypothetical protein
LKEEDCGKKGFSEPLSSAVGSYCRQSKFTGSAALGSCLEEQCLFPAEKVFPAPAQELWKLHIKSNRFCPTAHSWGCFIPFQMKSPAAGFSFCYALSFGRLSVLNSGNIF